MYLSVIVSKDEHLVNTSLPNIFRVFNLCK